MLTTYGFVLNKKNIKEFDREYCFFTKKYGKIHLIAKSVRKPLSKLSAQLEPPSLVEIVFVPMGNKGLITTALIKKSFLKTHRNLNKFKIYTKLVDIINSFSVFKQPDNLIWTLLNNSINNLECWNSKIVELNFLTKFLKILGFGLNTFTCVNCQKKLKNQKRIYFDKNKWGFCCENCGKNTDEISWQLFKSIDVLTNISFNDIVKRELNDPIESRYNDIYTFLKNYIIHIKKYF